MEAPLCPKCDTRHWSKQACKGSSSEEGEGRAQQCQPSAPERAKEVAERVKSQARPLTIEDVRRKNRERKRRWYERLKSDPVRYAAYLERERERKRK